MTNLFYSLPPEIRGLIFDTVWRLSPVTSFHCVNGLVRIVPHGHSSTNMTDWLDYEIPREQSSGLPQWLLVSKMFWYEGVDCLHRYPTGLYLNDTDDKLSCVPKSSSELWYQLAIHLNVFVPLYETWFLPSDTNQRSISAKNTQYLASLASLLTSKGRTKHLTIILQDDCGLQDETFGHIIESGFITPRPIYFSELHVIAAVIPQLQTFEIIFEEMFDPEFNDAAFIVMRHELHESLRRNIEALDFFDTRDMTLEMKNVEMDFRHAHPASYMFTYCCFIFKRN